MLADIITLIYWHPGTMGVVLGTFGFITFITVRLIIGRSHP